MSNSKDYDAVVIGSGPNGLAAAVTLVQQGLHVKVFEAKETIGGGTRTRECTLPGFKHDICSAIHPMAASSPFFESLPLHEHGLQWIYPEYPLAHPLDNEPAAILYRSLYETANDLGRDNQNYKKLYTDFVKEWDTLAPQLLGPFSPFPSTPLLMAKFGMKALRSAQDLANSTFDTNRARALFAGIAAHSIISLDNLATAAVGLVLGIVAHKRGWPLARGGSHAVTHALASYFQSMGGELEVNRKITSLDQLPPTHALFFDTSPHQVLKIAESDMPASYAKKLRKFEYGAGVFKLDLALDGPIPWKDDRCKKAGTVHVGGTLEEIAESEKAMSENRHPAKPFVLVAQQSMFDDSRAPEGKHTCWAYCHVPNSSEKDMTEPILNQIERFAPGFRDLIIGQHSMNTKAIYEYNPNYIGGDISGGRQDITQLFTRPVKLFDPYHIPKTPMYICSASTPPGGGVHGMCGYHAAQSALKREFG